MELIVLLGLRSIIRKVHLISCTSKILMVTKDNSFVQFLKKITVKFTPMKQLTRTFSHSNNCTFTNIMLDMINLNVLGSWIGWTVVSSCVFLVSISDKTHFSLSHHFTFTNIILETINFPGESSGHGFLNRMKYRQ